MRDCFWWREHAVPDVEGFLVLHTDKLIDARKVGIEGR
jgi:hypothetical protein